MSDAPSRLADIVIIIIGLIATTVAGVLVYRSIAFDGDDVTGRPAGGPQRVVNAQATPPPETLVKVGFSLNNDGVIDAWAYHDQAGATRKIEVSRRRDGVVDRWEYYENGQLTRAEQDDDRDGRVDRWLTYDAGIMMSEVVDGDGNGQPD